MCFDFLNKFAFCISLCYTPFPLGKMYLTPITFFHSHNLYALCFSIVSSMLRLQGDMIRIFVFTSKTENIQ